MPSSAFTKFQAFSEHLLETVHDLDGDTLKVYLPNTAPNVATHAVKADLAEISAGAGYAAGGVDVENTTSRSGGTTSVVAVDKTITASGGNVGPFRYAVLYNDTPAAGVVDPLIGYWDYGSAVTVLDGETFDLDFGASILDAA
jgi:hypothetical protein